MQKIKETKNSITYRSNKGYILQMHCNYPKKNPRGVIEAITDVLTHLKVFDGLNNQ